MKFNETDITDPIFREGDGIKITADPATGQVILAAPNTNKTTIKQGPFTLTGDCVELVAGSNIRITSAMPNRIIIAADIAKETARIVDLENLVSQMRDRMEVMERAFSQIIKVTKKV